MQKTYTFIITSLSLLLINISSSAQQSDSSKIKLKIWSESKLYHQGLTAKVKKDRVHLDNVSDMSGFNIEPKYKYATDAPFQHSAFYSLLSSRVSLSDAYYFNLDVLMEHRGMSYGIYSTNNIVVYPYYLLGMNDTFPILGENISIKAETGSFRNAILHKGLKLYNIDYQGIDVAVKWRDFILSYTQVGDLGVGMGLGLDEVFDISTGYEYESENGHQFQLGVNYCINFYNPSDDDRMLHLKFLIWQTEELENFRFATRGFWLSYRFKKSLHVYAESEVRKDPYWSIRENGAALLGVEFKHKGDGYALSINSELRYFGWLYNYGMKDESIAYRKSIQNEADLYNNNVGDNLYPLMNYEYGFSQWAVYTDYQRQNVAGIEIRALIEKKLWKELWLKAEAENCNIYKLFYVKDYPSGFSSTAVSKPFTYTFFTSHLEYRLNNFMVFGCGLTNKSMNLDKHYQTFYMRKKPVADFYIQCKFGVKG